MESAAARKRKEDDTGAAWRGVRYGCTISPISSTADSRHPPPNRPIRPLAASRLARFASLRCCNEKNKMQADCVGRARFGVSCISSTNSSSPAKPQPRSRRRRLFRVSPFRRFATAHCPSAPKTKQLRGAALVVLIATGAFASELRYYVYNVYNIQYYK